MSNDDTIQNCDPPLSSSTGPPTHMFQPISHLYNEILDQISLRDGLLDETVFATLICRFTTVHQLHKALSLFYRRKDFSLELGPEAFRSLFIWLCNTTTFKTLKLYKDVERDPE
ncbi:hypothetical protein VNO78_30954 [Psophocarpus tetragonolobus]|uniref:Uncharacterized protein n=1 Tax=Psophocarpus tetragonolobus TaxID=3891 RepID=A0AAN9RXK2_PSOTE